jgi:hypothetical protein
MITCDIDRRIYPIDRNVIIYFLILLIDWTVFHDL